MLITVTRCTIWEEGGVPMLEEGADGGLVLDDTGFEQLEEGAICCKPVDAALTAAT